MSSVKFEQICSTRAAERRRCGGLRPSLHWKGLLFIARASRFYRAAPLEEFVVYCSCLQIISYIAPPGAAQRARVIAQ